MKYTTTENAMIIFEEKRHSSHALEEARVFWRTGDKMFEQAINWRIANNLFRNPQIRFSSGNACESAKEALAVFLPQDKNFDVRQIRDWLHDPDNNTCGYKMIGCFRDSMITGIKFLFHSATDAVYFRLSFSGVATAAPK